MRIGRNVLCPCGSGGKFKQCCQGRVDWEQLVHAPTNTVARHLTLHGKNMWFLGGLMEALQLNGPAKSFGNFKRAFTPTAVAKIYQLSADLWPDLEDFKRVMSPESVGPTSALFTGNYEASSLQKILARHSLYSDHIYLVDPFLDYRRVAEQFNPIVHPEEHRGNAIKFSRLWLDLAPWIQARLVHFVRPLTDFVPGLNAEVLAIQRSRIESNANLKAALDAEVKAAMNKDDAASGGMTEYHVLSHPDEFFRDTFRKNPSPLFKNEDEFLSYICGRRENHPFYVDFLPGQKADFIHETSGANYELAKRMCELTGSHIITDRKFRWAEIEFDRKESGIDESAWTPFAKAMQNANLKVLEGISLEDALRLRSENRLESLRLFLRRVWKKAREPNDFDASNATSLAAELDDQIKMAREEWAKIDRDLMTWMGTAAAGLVATSFVGFMPAASVGVVGGAAAILRAGRSRADFKERFPAGFFLGRDK
jgi:hypothetical protein